MAVWKIAFVTLVVALAVTARPPTREDDKDDNPDIPLGTPELIERRGYPVETHVVQTKDGYVLNMHRIPHGIKEEGNSTGPRPVVYLQHGLIASSADWVIMGPEQGFAYLLADAGYDVWMGNGRGNRYSRNHVSLDPEKEAFWDFSWHEMAYYDIPAEVDYVIAKTGQKKIFYAGHSMGTTMFYVMNSLRPEYNTKFRAMFSLAPIAFLGKAKSPMRFITPFIDQVEWIAKMIGMNEFLPNSEFINLIGSSLCKDEAKTQDVCSNVMFLLCGYDSQQLNETAIPVMLSHTPAGTATKVVIHYGQEFKSKKFRQYDYGAIGNWKHYGSLHPPDYDLSLVTAPVYLHYSDNDWFAHPDDVMTLYKSLPNVMGKIKVPLKAFNHLDYLWAIDVKTLLYDKVMALMSRH